MHNENLISYKKSCINCEYLKQKYREIRKCEENMVKKNNLVNELIHEYGKINDRFGVNYLNYYKNMNLNKIKFFKNAYTGIKTKYNLYCNKNKFNDIELEL